MKWGVGVSGAEERMRTVAQEELLQNPIITIELLSITQDFYSSVYQENRKNKTAFARNKLMQYMIDLMRNESH